MYNPYLTMVFAGIAFILFFIIAWFSFFGTRTRKSKKVIRQRKEGYKEKVSLSSIRIRNQRFIMVSNALNFMPIGHLTKERKEEINRKLATTHQGDTAIKIAEEIHVESWLFAFVFLLFILVLMIFWKGFGLFVLATPFVFKIPESSISLSIMDEEETLQEEFINFFNVYYVQFKRVGRSMRLIDVIQTYKNLAPPEMQSFVARIEVDLASGEAHALKMLDRRYCHNPDIHRFCSVAASISRGDSKSEKIIESLQDELTARDIQRRRTIVQKRMEMVERVQGAMLYTICVLLLVVSFVFTAAM